MRRADVTAVEASAQAQLASLQALTDTASRGLRSMTYSMSCCPGCKKPSTRIPRLWYPAEQ
jgi:hypothetical protein